MNMPIHQKDLDCMAHHGMPGRRTLQTVSKHNSAHGDRA